MKIVTILHSNSEIQYIKMIHKKLTHFFLSCDNFIMFYFFTFNNKKCFNYF